MCAQSPLENSSFSQDRASVCNPFLGPEPLNPLPESCCYSCSGFCSCGTRIHGTNLSSCSQGLSPRGPGFPSIPSPHPSHSLTHTHAHTGCLGIPRDLNEEPPKTQMSSGLKTRVLSFDSESSKIRTPAEPTVNRLHRGCCHPLLPKA